MKPLISDPKILAAYTRVSTVGQAASGIGLAAQRAAITEAAQSQGVTVVEWFEDAGRSGASMRNRPGLAAALEAVRQVRAGGIIAAKVDRIGRSSADVLGLVERAQKEGWRLVVLDVGLDSSSPAGELVITALAMAARFEYRRISERQREKFAQMRLADPDRPRGRTRLPRHIGERICGMRESGATLQAISDHLTAEGIPTSQGGEKWRPSSVKAALRTLELEGPTRLRQAAR